MNCGKLLVLVMLVGTLGLVGCNNKKKQAGGAQPMDPMAQPIPPAPEPIIISEPMPGPAMQPQQSMGGSVAAGQNYTVQRGDTLMSIARKHYGSASKFRDIQAANGLSDPNKIKVGQVLILP